MPRQRKSRSFGVTFTDTHHGNEPIRRRQTMATFKCGKCGFEKDSRCKPQKCPQCGEKKTFEKSEKKD